MAESSKRDKNYKQDVTVNSAFILDPVVTLLAKPKSSSDFVFLNGLLLPDDCYSISGKILTFDGALPFKVGDLVMIRYVA